MITQSINNFIAIEDSLCMCVCVYIFIKRYELGLQFKENIMLQFIKENIMLAEQKQHPWSCPRGW